MANTVRHRDDELTWGDHGVGALVPFGPCGADPMRRRPMNKRAWPFSVASWPPGRTGVIALPYGWLLLFFLFPFLILVKISVSEMETVNFKDLITYKDGVLALALEAGQLCLHHRRRPVLQVLCRQPEVRRRHHLVVPVHWLSRFRTSWRGPSPRCNPPC